MNNRLVVVVCYICLTNQLSSIVPIFSLPNLSPNQLSDLIDLEARKTDQSTTTTTTMTALSDDSDDDDDASLYERTRQAADDVYAQHVRTMAQTSVAANANNASSSGVYQCFCAHSLFAYCLYTL
jgi:hypothetical protein